jgi:hypothetical protein
MYGIDVMTCQRELDGAWIGILWSINDNRPITFVGPFDDETAAFGAAEWKALELAAEIAATQL